MKPITKNGGQKSRDRLAAAVNRSTEDKSNTILCFPQYAADVIEQRDELLKALKVARSYIASDMDGGDDSPLLADIDAAIAKAKGI